MTQNVEFLTDHIPEPGEVFEIVPGIQWIRMPLPFQLNHINLWLIEEEDGWALIDCGINDERTKDLWRGILGQVLNGKPLTKIICTHAHPDHIGLAGWLHAEYGAELVISREEWTFGRMVSTGGLKDVEAYNKYFLQIGCAEEDLEDYCAHIMTADKLYCDVPHRYRRLREDRTVTIGGKSWQVIVGLGHAMEHVCLYCAESNILIAGDQVLPKITPTILVHANEPNANPLLDFLESNEKLRHLPEDVTVLPSHNQPFTGLHTRLDYYITHHEERLETVLAACDEALNGLEVAGALFPQDLDIYGKFFATGEAMSHIRYLEYEGKLKRSNDADGIERYQRI
ncbi:MAG: MBL fold metallo-hydrolase [Rhodospirillaceae bacterium]|nr:MBL fold metallo-hydrolase [Rhodospirillaceae bacterium]MBT4588586.1 MBL fold metallo-hydrolase [Rhodospirillaceae bacterium]MBT5941037.1 MBL fold metallo-hydrolase [Rhodospirillaceae bacterium]MBT7266309.1 MBL fold metallo-hydrolase [Rhodospirillaceae bacterium]